MNMEVYKSSCRKYGNKKQCDEDYKYMMCRKVTR